VLTASTFAGTIDVVVCNLYPFAATVASGGSAAECIEKIDIGGPSMIRAAAKNHGDVFVITDPSDYAPLLAALRAGDAGAGATLRVRLAWKAFAHCAAYDAAVAEWFWESGGARRADEPRWPPLLTVPLALVSGLRYGENPHQGAAFYTCVRAGGVPLERRICIAAHNSTRTAANPALRSGAARAWRARSCTPARRCRTTTTWTLTPRTARCATLTSPRAWWSSTPTRVAWPAALTC
jgi:hypothetical protein